MTATQDPISTLLAWCERNGSSVLSGDVRCNQVATAVRALQAENAALKAPAAPRRLREYKGVTYDATENYPWRYLGDGFKSAAGVIHYRYGTFTDADHAAIYALKDDPYLPVETLEDVLRQCAETNGYHTIDDAVDATAKAVRAWLATQEPTP
jgi:hypothetical protein